MSPLAIERTVVVFDPATLDEMLNGDDGAVATYLTKLAIRAQGVAMMLCPVDTGRLRASIRWACARDPQLRTVCAWVGSDVEYAIYVECGTYKMAAEPYLRPAVDQVLGDTDLVNEPIVYDDNAWVPGAP